MHMKAKSNKQLSKSKTHFGKGCHTDLEWTNQIPECPVYHPSMEDFQDPLEYLQKIAPEASRYGLCKIVPPITSASPTGVIMMKENPDFKFTPKLQPLRLPKWTTNDKNTFLNSTKSYTLRDFEVMANRVTANKYRLSGCLPSSYLEKEFWHAMIHGKKGTVEYGVNVDGSAFSSSSNDLLANSKWNLKKLPRLPKSALHWIKNGVPGVTDPMLYIGMLFSMFAWHVEDHYLYSINYHHCGAPKTWYGVPNSAVYELEKVVHHHVYSKEILSKNGAFELLAEKTTMFPPNILLQNHIPVYKLVQLPGEFVVTFPRAYHAGFSHGFNCGEAVNFAARDWFPFGEAANERYTVLKKQPVIPYEEILCKEAMRLSKKDDNAVSNRFVKVPFATMIRKYDNTLKKLKSVDKSITVSSNLKETVGCGICKRDCYVAYVKCECRTDQMCVFHDKELLNCDCGSNRFLFERADLVKMKDVVRKFEDLVKKVEKQRKPKHCMSGVSNRVQKCRHGSNRAKFAGTKIQYSKASARKNKRSKKVKGKSNVKVGVARLVNRRGTRGKVGISPKKVTPSKKRTRSSCRLKELKNCKKRASQCHLCAKYIH
ncbi:hypothetical protein LXL04_010908 [Taraxacum kok-saghyz]